MGMVQAFGCAVEEEVAVAAVTNYMVTLFIKRPMDVRDKKLYVSDPVWFDQTQPPAKACCTSCTRPSCAIQVTLDAMILPNERPMPFA